MELRYYIDTTLINEPIGFDDFKVNIKRTKFHGVSVENSVGELEFDGVAFDLVKAAYQSNIDSQLIFKAELKCIDSDTFETIYDGIIDLSTYKEQFTDYCSCICKVAEIGAKTTFNNRIDTDVDVNSLVSLDEDALSIYTQLNKEIEILAKDIEFTTTMKRVAESNDLRSGISPSNVFSTQFAFNNPEITELDGYNIVNDLTEGVIFPYDANYFYKKLSSTITNVHVSGRALFVIGTDVAFTFSSCELNFYKETAPSTKIKSYTFEKIHPNNSYILSDIYFDFVTSLALNEKILCAVILTSAATSTNVSMICNADSYIKITGLESKTNTFGNVNMIHETFSRVSEIISGITVKSEWLGRSNSDVNPYFDLTKFIPSLNELQLIRDNLYAYSIGDFEGNWWSSSEVDADYAWFIQFVPNTQRNDGYKTSFSTIGVIVCEKYTIAGSQIYNLRDVGANGGYVFNVVANTGSFTYYEAQSVINNIAWSDDVTLLGGTSTAVGSGLTNTNLMRAFYTDSAATKAQTAVGGGAMKALIKGLELRKAIYTDGNKPTLFVSFKDLIENINAIDNIGFGFSTENNTLFVRVEKMDWFYQDEVLLTITDPANKKRAINLDNYKTKLQVGYSKFVEKDELNSINTLHTLRNYSTKIKAIDVELKAICDYIADPYAIEFTRVLSETPDTKDWKYDDNIFVLETEMLKADNTISHLNENLSISPARNAANFNSQLFFANNTVLKNWYISGSGFFTAINKVELLPYSFQHQDNGLNDYVSENADINRSEHFIKPELLSFEYPITKTNYDTIKANPYGTIVVDGENTYLQDLNYEPLTGMAEFKVIPKNEI